MPSISNISRPVSPRVAASSPGANWSGSTPMPTRFERWMRSKLFAMTARTPSSLVPLAAQSRDEPGAVLGAGDHDAAARPRPGTAWTRRRCVVLSPSGRCTVMPPSSPGRGAFLRRMLANVPRIITSWLPRRAPYELKSAGATPCSTRYFAGGAVLGDGAGRGDVVGRHRVAEQREHARAPRMSVSGAGSFDSPSKNGGLRT